MEPADEKFFESLADAKNDADQEETNGYEVELARAGSSAVMEAPKMIQRAAKKAWSANEPEGQLTVDVYQTPMEIVVESAIAGVDPEDIDVHVTTDSITVRGARHHEKEVRDQDYLYQECYWGRFARSIILPQEVDPESSDVILRNGILTVRMPKLNKKKSRKLKVRVE